MKKVYQIFILALLLSIPLLSGSISYAGQGMKIGELEIKPWGEVKLQYDDNVFLDRYDEKDDLIYTLTPGIGLKLPFQDNFLKFDYHADIIKFSDYSSQDATNHYASGELDLNWSDININLHDSFARVFDRPSTEDTSRVKRDDNTAGVTVKLQKERLGIQIGYDNFTRDYRSDASYDNFDRKENRYSLMLTHQTFPKTKLLFEYDFNQIRYDNDSTNSDSDYHQFLVGAMGEITPKTTATIKTGYQFSNYKNAGSTDFKSGVLYADMTHRFSDKDALKLQFLRTAYESTFGTNNYYTVNNVSGTYDHYFTRRLLGFITGLYQENSYPKETTVGGETKKRKDRYYSIGPGLRYYLKDWFTLTLHLEHIERDSNFDIYKYDQNLATISARAEF